MNLKKKIIALAACLAITPFFSQGVVTTNGLLRVSGNRIVNESGSTFKVAGNSLYWSGFEAGFEFYTAENAPRVVNHLANEWNSGIIRAAMAVEEADGSFNLREDFSEELERPNMNANGYFNNSGREQRRIEAIIDAAIENDIYVIVDFHTHFAHFFEDEAITFFTDIATKYGDNDHIIYEIFNEPISVESFRNDRENEVFSSKTLQRRTWNEIIKPYAINVINAIRAIDPDNLIVVGTPGFSQFVDIAKNNKITESDLALLPNAALNLAYTLHFYAGTHRQELRNIAQQALNGPDGIALFVTEWGSVAANGNGNVDVAETLLWMDFLNENNISHANWSIGDPNESSAVVQANRGVNGLLNNELTPSGSFVRCIIENFNTNRNFSQCNDNISPSANNQSCGVGGRNVVPEGIGTKVEVETTVGQFDVCGNRSDFRSSGLATDTFETQGIVRQFSRNRSVVFSLEPISESGNYAIQVVFSTNNNTSELFLERSSGTEQLGSVRLPNTGGLNNYQMITLRGIPFSSNAKDIALKVSGNRNVHIESFYYTLNNNLSSKSVETSINSSISNDLSVHPIPAHSTINIGNLFKNTPVNYSIFDLQGKEIISKQKLENNQVNINALQKGFYLLQLNNGIENKILKFIKE